MLLKIEEDKDRDKKKERYKEKTKKTKTDIDEISACAIVPTLWVGNAAQKSFTKTKIGDKSAPSASIFCNGKQVRTESSLGHKAICGEHACGATTIKVCDNWRGANSTRSLSQKLSERQNILISRLCLTLFEST